MTKSMLASIACLAAALAVAGGGISTDGFARGGHGGGGHFHGAGGFGTAGGFSVGDAPSVLPTPTTPDSSLGRDLQGLNFNDQMRNAGVGAHPRHMRTQPQNGTINGQLGEGTELGPMDPSINSQLERMNGQPGTVTLP